MSEVYDAGVLADVQQAQRIVAAFLTAESFSGLLRNVSFFALGQICRIGSACRLQELNRLACCFISCIHCKLMRSRCVENPQNHLPAKSNTQHNATASFRLRALFLPNASKRVNFC